MGAYAMPVDEQIRQLKARGMAFDRSLQKVKEILMDIGYYRLGFYWQPFEKDKGHHFKGGTQFSDVVHLYYLDVDLREVLLKYLNRIEINFRTRLVYHVSNHYSDSPTWFADPRVVEKPFLSQLDFYYDERFKKNNKPIKAHHKKYINHKYAPAWKTLEFFSFGTIITLFKSLKEKSLKTKIANDYGIRNLRKFTDHMHTILLIRNVCAHGGLLYDLSLPKGVNMIPDFNFERKDRQTLGAAVRLIAFYLGKISKNRQNDLISRIRYIIQNPELPSVIQAIAKERLKIFFSGS